MAVGAIARVLLGLAVKGLKKSKPKKVVKKPKGAKTAKLSSADDAKAGAEWKRMKKAEAKDARTAKRMDKDGTEAHNKRVRATRTRVIDKPPSRKSPNATRVEMKVTRAGKRPVTTAKKVAVAAVAAAAANAGTGKEKSKPRIYKKTTKPVRWRNSKRVGRVKVASKLRTEYNPKTDQWIKYTD